MEGVKYMLHEKMDRHRRVWDQFVAIRDKAKEDLEQEVASQAAELRVRLVLASLSCAVL
jgi:hypothetical protein